MTRKEQIFKQLHGLVAGIYQDIDEFELRLLAAYLEDYEKITKLIEKEKNPYVNQHGQIHPLQTQRNKTIDIILKLGDRFGLNPQARDKNKGAFDKPKVEDNPLAKFVK